MMNGKNHVRLDFIPPLKDRSDRKTHTNVTALKNRSNQKRLLMGTL